MQRLFRLDNSAEAGSFLFKHWNYIQTGMRQNVGKVIDYYRQYPNKINSSHVLIRLLFAMNMPRSMSFDRYISNAFDLAIPTAQSIQLTTATTRGKLWDGEFYGGCKEVIIANNDFFDFSNAINEWRDYEPIKILAHNQTNLNLALPDGRTQSGDAGVCFISVNVPMLMAQYYFFNKEQDDIVLDTEMARRTAQQFVLSYPINNALKSQTDLVIFNRLYAQLTGTPMLPGYIRQPFGMPDLSASIYACFEDEIKILSTFQGKWSGVLKAVPMVFSNNLLELSKLPEIPPTIQCMWALMASRLKMLDFLTRTSRSYKSRNQQELNHINWLFRTHQVKNAIRGNLGVAQFFGVEPYIARLEA